MTINVDAVREANALIARHARLVQFLAYLADPNRDLGLLCGSPHDAQTWQGFPLWLGKDDLYRAAVTPVLKQRALECEARLRELGVEL